MDPVGVANWKGSDNLVCAYVRDVEGCASARSPRAGQALKDVH